MLKHPKHLPCLRPCKRYVWDDVDRMWDFHDTDHDGFVNLDEHKEVYGLVSGESGGVIYTD